jgi:hypothetical protein
MPVAKLQPDKLTSITSSRMLVKTTSKVSKSLGNSLEHTVDMGFRIAGHTKIIYIGGANNLSGARQAWGGLMVSKRAIAANTILHFMSSGKLAKMERPVPAHRQCIDTWY